MVTVAEIARTIGIPATTAREYVGRFKSFFPTKKVSGKRYPMHPESAEDIMRDIVDSYAKGLTTDDITNVLKEKYPMSADVVEEEETKTNGHNQHTNGNGKALADTSALQLISQMNNMQMQLMQKMTEVLDRNNQVMERVVDALDHSQKRKSLPDPSGMPTMPAQPQPSVTENGIIPQDQKLPPPPPKKFIMPSKEELEKRKKQGWLSRMFGK